MMDHALKSISYIADIGDILVIMARRRYLSSSVDNSPTAGHNTVSDMSKRQAQIVCHVFESDEASLIAQSIGHAFQVCSALLNFDEHMCCVDCKVSLQVKTEDYQLQHCASYLNFKFLSLSLSIHLLFRSTVTALDWAIFSYINYLASTFVTHTRCSFLLIACIFYHRLLIWTSFVPMESTTQVCN